MLDVPYLLATQLQSFKDFLQDEVFSREAEKRRLAGRVHPDFPDRFAFRQCRLEFVSYMLGEPAFDVTECQQRGLTFAARRCVPRSVW